MISPVKEALRELRKQARESIRTLVEIRDDKGGSREDRVRAAVALLNLTGITKIKPRQGKGTRMSVVKRTPAGMRDTVAAAAEDRERAQAPEAPAGSGSRGPPSAIG